MKIDFHGLGKVPQNRCSQAVQTASDAYPRYEAGVDELTGASDRWSDASF